jgi:hypothetical protein
MSTNDNFALSDLLSEEQRLCGLLLDADFLVLVDLPEKDRQGISDPVVSAYDLHSRASFNGTCHAMKHVF